MKLRVPEYRGMSDYFRLEWAVRLYDELVDSTRDPKHLGGRVRAYDRYEQTQREYIDKVMACEFKADTYVRWYDMTKDGGKIDSALAERTKVIGLLEKNPSESKTLDSLRLGKAYLKRVQTRLLRQPESPDETRRDLEQSLKAYGLLDGERKREVREVGLLEFARRELAGSKKRYSPFKFPDSSILSEMEARVKLLEELSRDETVKKLMNEILSP
jgi:hypothetical protein